VLLIYVVVSTSVTLCSLAADYYSKYQHMNLCSRKNHQSLFMLPVVLVQ
jgi:hypothetical protein